MIDIDKIRIFYDKKEHQSKFSEEIYGSDFFPDYFKSPYLFVEDYLVLNKKNVKVKI